MTPRDLIDDLRSRINPAYAAQIGTESWERRLCAEALEAQAEEIERLTTAGLEAADVLRQEAAILRDCHTLGGKWDDEDSETQAHYYQILALADRLTPRV